MDVVFTWPIETLLVLAGVVVSMLVSLVTSKVTNARTKAYLLAGLSAVAKIIAEVTIAVQADQTFDAGQALLRAIGTLLVAVGAFHLITVPTG